MARIGLAYNQKPAVVPEGGAASSSSSAEIVAADEEPPSRGLSSASRPDDEFAEWDAPETIDAVARALAAHGEVVRLEATDDFPERLRRERPDIVFNIAEGLRGVNRESHVPAICEFYGVPYSGSDPFTLSLCLDKARAKETLLFHGVPTAPWRVVRTDDDADALLDEIADGGLAEAAASGTLGAGRPALALPLFVKPLHEGSSKGITERNLVRTTSDLAAMTRELLAVYRQPVLVEAYLPGAEFTCAVLGNGADARVLPIVGMNFDALPDGAAPVYGYEAKWVWDRPERPLAIFECPARVPDELGREIERVTLAAYRAVGCRDWARVDVRLDAAGRANVVEINPLPGILPDPADNSCLPKAARAAGLEYDALIAACLTSAAARAGVRLGSAR